MQSKFNLHTELDYSSARVRPESKFPCGVSLPIVATLGLFFLCLKPHHGYNTAAFLLFFAQSVCSPVTTGFVGRIFSPAIEHRPLYAEMSACLAPVLSGAAQGMMDFMLDTRTSFHGKPS